MPWILDLVWFVPIYTKSFTLLLKFVSHLFFSLSNTNLIWIPDSPIPTYAPKTICYNLGLYNVNNFKSMLFISYNFYKYNYSHPSSFWFSG